jgi:hypothetical protein
VSRLRRLPRGELEAEARRLGIAEPGTLGREALIDLVARRSDGRGARRPRSLLGRALALARRTLDDATSRLSPVPPPRPVALARPPEPARVAPAPRAAEPPVSASPPPSSTTPAPPAPPPRARAAIGEPPFLEDEPIPTRTMARLLRAQGHYRRALAIYDGLVRSHPSDPGLRGEAAELRAEAREVRGRLDQPEAGDDDPGGDEADGAPPRGP